MFDKFKNDPWEITVGNKSIHFTHRTGGTRIQWGAKIVHRYRLERA